MMNNIGLAYQKTYFSNLKVNSITGKVALSINMLNDFEEYSLNPEDHEHEWEVYTHTIKLKTLYPGLVVGMGYNHEIGGREVENELKLGMHFDYTSGLPVIPGSSIKGVIRSIFKKDGGSYIKEFLKTNNDSSDINDLEKIIFENGSGIGLYERDIFFDAIPTKSFNNNKQLLGNDYITHHESPVASPNPVQFLKVLPDVVYSFFFKLNDFGCPADLKLKLFNSIIADFGIGAKTNVGYGAMESINEDTASPSSGDLSPGFEFDPNIYMNQVDLIGEITHLTDTEISILLDDNHLPPQSINKISDRMEKRIKREQNKGNTVNFEPIAIGSKVSVKITQNEHSELGYSVAIEPLFTKR